MGPQHPTQRIGAFVVGCPKLWLVEVLGPHEPIQIGFFFLSLALWVKCRHFLCQAYHCCETQQQTLATQKGLCVNCNICHSGCPCWLHGGSFQVGCFKLQKTPHNLGNLVYLSSLCDPVQNWGQVTRLSTLLHFCSDPFCFEKLCFSFSEH